MINYLLNWSHQFCFFFISPCCARASRYSLKLFFLFVLQFIHTCFKLTVPSRFFFSQTNIIILQCTYIRRTTFIFHCTWIQILLLFNRCCLYYSVRSKSNWMKLGWNRSNNKRVDIIFYIFFILNNSLMPFFTSFDLWLFV